MYLFLFFLTFLSSFPFPQKVAACPNNAKGQEQEFSPLKVKFFFDDPSKEIQDTGNPQEESEYSDGTFYSETDSDDAACRGGKYEEDFDFEWSGIKTKSAEGKKRKIFAREATSEKEKLAEKSDQTTELKQKVLQAVFQKKLLSRPSSDQPASLKRKRASNNQLFGSSDEEDNQPLIKWRKVKKTNVRGQENCRKSEKKPLPSSSAKQENADQNHSRKTRTVRGKKKKTRVSHQKNSEPRRRLVKPSEMDPKEFWQEEYLKRIWVFEENASGLDGVNRVKKSPKKAWLQINQGDYSSAARWKKKYFPELVEKNWKKRLTQGW